MYMVAQFVTKKKLKALNEEPYKGKEQYGAVPGWLPQLVP